MANRHIKNRIIFPIALILMFLLIQVILVSCKKKENQQSAEPDKTETTAELELSEKIDLRILYAGHPKSEREKDFVNFLTKYFTQVETTDLKNFNESQSGGFDVTILDYDGDGFKAPHPMISENFTRPIVTVGVAGALMCSQWNLKTGYL